MLIQSNVGQPTYAASGATPNLRSGKQGDTILSELHGKYYEQTYNKNTFWAANQAVVTTTVGLATTYTGLALINPLGSTVTVAIQKVTLMQSVIATVVEAFSIATGFNATTQVTNSASVTTQTAKVGSGAVSSATASSSATLPTAPVHTTFIGASGTAIVDPTFNVVDLEGSIILMPGAYAIIACNAAVTSMMWFSFSWEENPL